MRIEFISAAFEQVAGQGNKRGYGKATVTYKAGGGVKTQGVMSFSNPTVYSQLEGFKQGDFLEVEVTKNAAGYNQWASVTKVDGNTSSGETSSPPSAPQRGSSTTYAARDFETKEERAQRQSLIVRQSSLSNAIAVLTTGAKTPPSVADVTNLADVFVGYVYNVGAGQAPNNSGFDDLPDDI